MTASLCVLVEDSATFRHCTVTLAPSCYGGSQVAKMKSITTSMTVLDP